MIVKKNVENTKMCATCVYWDDFARTAISPTPSRGVWEVDQSKKFFCHKKRCFVIASASCGCYERKIIDRCYG